MEQNGSKWNPVKGDFGPTDWRGRPGWRALRVSPRAAVRLAVVAVLHIASATVHADDAAEAEKRWGDAIAAFETADRKMPPPENGILFVGSSSIRLWKLDEHFPGLPVINRGFGGSQVSDTLHFAERIVLPYRPRVIVLYAGDNDIAAGEPPEQVVEDFQQLVATIHRELPNTRIVFIAIKPSIARWKLYEKMNAANEHIEKHCEGDDRLRFVDVAAPMLGQDGRPREELFVDDGLHLSDAGYRLWTKLVRPHLDE